jgi:hypothetical protein
MRYISLLPILLIGTFLLSGCTIDKGTRDYLREPRPRTYEYRIECFNNNKMLPAAEFWTYVHSEIDGTGYVKTKESWAERIDRTYLAQIWVYYEWQK